MVLDARVQLSPWPQTYKAKVWYWRAEGDTGADDINQGHTNHKKWDILLQNQKNKCMCVICK